MGLMTSRPWLGSSRVDEEESLHDACYDQDEVNKLLHEKDQEWQATFDKERQEYNSKIDQLKAKSKRQAKEIRQLKAVVAEEKEGRERLVQAEIEKSTEKVVQESRTLRQRMTREMYALVLTEAVKFLTFANFIMDNFLPHSTVMEDIVSEQDIFIKRIRADPAFVRSSTNSNQPTKQFQVHKPNEPNYAALKTDVINCKKEKNSPYYRLIKDPPALVNKEQASSAKPQHTMESLIAQVREVFPDLTDVDVVDHFVKIKALNRGTLVGLSMDKIMCLISSSVSAENGGGLESDLDNLNCDNQLLAQPECPICIEPMNSESNKVTIMDGCLHTFHDDCIRPWLIKKQQCPCCRKDQLAPVENWGRQRISSTNNCTDSVRQYSIWNSPTPFISTVNGQTKAWN